jgi:hypothetical protein
MLSFELMMCLLQDMDSLTLQAAVNGSFDKTQCLASLLAALNKYRPSLVLALVDILIEEVVHGLQHPSMHTPQASIAYTRLLCELYNFQVIKTSHLFSLLYLYITIGTLPRGHAVQVHCAMF